MGGFTVLFHVNVQQRNYLSYPTLAQESEPRRANMKTHDNKKPWVDTNTKLASATATRPKTRDHTYRTNN
ncbi:hypothetical protein GCM10009621_03870 [Corynebacterium felinum]